jgi:D-3-phosphoglycerate dehydrogenase
MKILNLDTWGDKATEILKPYRYNGGDPTWETNGIIASLEHRFTRQEIDEWPNLKFIASCTTGLDHIDTDYCKVKGIKIISLQGESILRDVYATAEHTWALILSLIRKVPWAFDDVKKGNWDRESWQGSELYGKTLGIVGYGRVGQQVARIAEGFGVKTLYNDIKNIDTADYGGNSLNAVLKFSDMVTVHVPLNKETTGMFGIEQFKMMKPTAYFINTSRGAVVDEKALLSALMNKQIAGAAIDVVNNEHAGEWVECNDPRRYLNFTLRDYAGARDNLIITPHIGGNTAESRDKTQIYIANKIVDFIKR